MTTNPDKIAAVLEGIGECAPAWHEHCPPGGAAEMRLSRFIEDAEWLKRYLLALATPPQK